MRIACKKKLDKDGSPYAIEKTEKHKCIIRNFRVDFSRASDGPYEYVVIEFDLEIVEGPDAGFHLIYRTYTTMPGDWEESTIPQFFGLPITCQTRADIEAYRDSIIGRKVLAVANVDGRGGSFVRLYK